MQPVTLQIKLCSPGRHLVCYIQLLHDEAIHQRKQLCVILANALDNAQLPYLEVYNALFVL